MKHRKRRPLFFPFGIITLAILPVLGFQKIAETYQLKTTRPHCIELLFPPSDTVLNSDKKFSELRKYTTYVLSADTARNGIILNLARQKLNHIKNEKDTLNGIHIVFNDSTKYSDFIRVINDSFEKFPPIFASYQNDFWSMYTFVDTAGWYERKRQQEWDRIHDSGIRKY